MSDGDLAALVRSYLDDDEVMLLADDPDRECRVNTWCYGVPDAAIDVPAVVAALHLVHRELGRRRASPGTFYAWYDEPAGQLRCSLTSAPADRLPFAAPYRSTTDAAEVVALVAADPNPGFVPCSELATVEPAVASVIAEPPPMPVWVAPLP
ncbi:hypothetical protein GA0074696_0577 [Micromonospora purpureochromogenes]|uniref:Uncharacterized protein n=1 Tax=Micromonospora purpureochromogenes TaxID=47872 RepID=A0A1C4URV6_9ACTN|nr:hypothetical protein [Micromonospora purpureochromogenes]SCE74362.1 hypothetical protein GA0074696_0577 [Micromonospora purpureochromogenes]